MKDINHIISKFSSVSLEEIDEVKLMSRIDRKFWFPLSKLRQILEQTLTDYDILEIEGQRLMDYQTAYFDTPENLMYLQHHNYKMNRFKIRQRRYISTNSSYLEVKLKTNKKVTIKSRVEAKFDARKLSPADFKFIKKETHFSGENLVPVLNNKFKRITIIHKNKLERCTIDISPVFWNETKKLDVAGLVIFELKRGQGVKISPIINTLRSLKIRQKGLSKYCTGRALLEPELKQNSFKPKLRFLYKEILN